MRRLPEIVVGRHPEALGAQRELAQHFTLSAEAIDHSLLAQQIGIAEADRDFVRWTRQKARR